MDRVAVESASGGWLSISALKEAWVEGVAARIEAAHYQPFEARLRVDSPEVIELEPSSSSSLRLGCRESAVPIEHLEVTTLDQHSIDRAGSWTSLSKDGVATLVHAVPLVVKAYGSNGTLYFCGVIAPDSDIQAESCVDGSVLRLAFSDGSPASGALLDVFNLGASNSRTFQHRADENGEIRLPLETTAVDIELPSNRLRFAPGEMQPSGIALVGRKLCLPRLPDGPGELLIQVQHAVNRLRLLDDRTGRPVQGIASYAKKVVTPRGEILVAPQYEAELKDGWIEFGVGFSTSRTVPRNVVGMVCVEGYRPLLLPSSAYPFAGLLDPPPVFEMHRVLDGSLLRVYSRDHGVDVGCVVIRSPASDEVIFVGKSRGEGAYGPFESGGNRIRVEIHSLQLVRDLDSTPQDTGLGLYEIRIDEDLGRLRVDSPSGGSLPALHLRNAAGLDLSQTRHEGSTCVFENLPPGRYLVGPPKWLIQLASVSEVFERFAVTVLPGVEVVTRANPDWTLESDIRGKLVLSGGVPRPALAAAYSTQVSLATVSSGPRIRMNADGSYVIAAGDPRPEVIVAFDFVNGAVHLRGAFRPGSTTQLCERPLTLTSNARGGLVRLAYPLPQVALGAALEAETSTSVWLDLRDGRMTVSIPCDVGKLELQVGKQGKPGFIDCPMQGAVGVDVDVFGELNPEHR